MDIERNIPSYSLEAPFALFNSEIEGEELVALAHLISEATTERGDFGPTITNALERLTEPSTPEQKARELTFLFNLRRKDRKHPLTSDYLTTLSQQHGFTPVEFVSESVEDTRGKRRFFEERGPDIRDFSSAADFRKALQSFPDIAVYRDGKQLAHFKEVFNRWISQALIYSDNGHSYTFGDPEKATAWLDLMKRSGFFYKEMIALAMINYLKASANVPPVDVYSHTCNIIPYNLLKEVYLAHGEKGVQNLWHRLSIWARTLYHTRKIQTTGIGRIGPLAERIYQFLDEEYITGAQIFGGNDHEATLRILNLGAGLLQSSDLLGLLEMKGIPVGDAHLSIDIQTLEELVTNVSAFRFVKDEQGSVKPDRANPLQGARAVATAQSLYPGLFHNHYTADISKPFPSDLADKIEEVAPNIVLSTNTIKPHLTPDGELQAYVNILSHVNNPLYILHLSGGYIGSSELVRGITALVTRKNDQISIYPIDLQLQDGWESESGIITINNVGGIILRNETLEGISSDTKPCFYEDRLPGYTSNETTSEAILQNSDTTGLATIYDRLRAKEKFPLSLSAGSYTSTELTRTQWLQEFRNVFSIWAQKGRRINETGETYRQKWFTEEIAEKVFAKFFFHGSTKAEAWELYTRLYESAGLPDKYMAKRNTFYSSFLPYVERVIRLADFLKHVRNLQSVPLGQLAD